jgi:elongation of very long chain fatty acids protein 6
MWGSVIMYVAFLIFGPMVIKKTGPIPGLRWPLVFWNIFLSVGSTWMAWDSTSDLVTTAINKPLRYTVCDGSFLEGRLGFMAMLFALSKIPELVDTVFLILRQKPVILLHYYHHISVLMYCYWCYQLGSPTFKFYKNYILNFFFLNFFFFSK